MASCWREVEGLGVGGGRGGRSGPLLNLRVSEGDQ